MTLCYTLSGVTKLVHVRTVRNSVCTILWNGVMEKIWQFSDFVIGCSAHCAYKQKTFLFNTVAAKNEGQARASNESAERDDTWGAERERRRGGGTCGASKDH